MNPLQVRLSGLAQRVSQFDAIRVAGERTAGWLAPRTAFVRELLHEPRSVGAVCPSSGALAWRMAASVDATQPGWIIELGGGTGMVTQALLQRGVARERLIVIERSRHFVDHLRARFPGVRIVHADAADMARGPLEGRSVAAIVSSLPLRSLPADVVSRVVQAGAGVLDTRSRVVQFTYARRACSAWSDAGLQRIASETVWRNLPPARVDVFAPAASPDSAPDPACQAQGAGVAAPSTCASNAGADPLHATRSPEHEVDEAVLDIGHHELQAQALSDVEVGRLTHQLAFHGRAEGADPG